MERQPIKKCINPFGLSISNVFAIKDPFKKDDVQQKEFDEDLGLLIIKNNLPIQFVDSVSFKRLILYLCLKFYFSFQKVIFIKDFAKFGGEN